MNNTVSTSLGTIQIFLHWQGNSVQVFVSNVFPSLSGVINNTKTDLIVVFQGRVKKKKKKKTKKKQQVPVLGKKEG